MLLTIKNKIILILQLILVITYIIFEELIWEGIAKPIYTFMHSLEILQKIEVRLHDANAYFILTLFILLLLLVEGFGLYAGVLLVSGHVLLGLSLYLAKIPIAGFTFWLFRVTEDKLMEFGWFKWLYEMMMQGIIWLKATEGYLSTMERFTLFETKFKVFKTYIKNHYFSGENLFVLKIKKLYTLIKMAFRK